MASSLPVKNTMNHTCQHCGESIVGNAYRVTSEDEGIPLLDMIVCSLCFMEAKRLHFMRRKSVLKANKQLQLETRGVTVRDSAFNFNTGSSFTRGSPVVL